MALNKIINFKFWLRILFFLSVIFYHMSINLYSQTIPLINISGYVFDSATGLPIENANVFLSFTTMGDVSDKNGLFSIIRVPVGHYSLIVSMMGYEIEKKRIKLRAANGENFNFKLKQKILKTEGIEVSATVPKDWKKALQKFERYFLGDSENASYCTILNPEYLNFSFHPKSDSLSASSSQPINVENKALGYKISFNLLEFRAQRYSKLRFIVTAKFDTLFTENEKEKKRWLKNRNRAYLGSIRHFLASLAAKTIDKEGFTIYGAFNTEIDYQKKLKIENILSAGKSDYERLLSFKNYLKVIYSGEKEPYEYQPYFSSGNNCQTSWIKMLQNSVVFNIDGHLNQPDAFTKYGYWGWERTADMLPLDFKLVKDE